MSRRRYLLPFLSLLFILLSRLRACCFCFFAVTVGLHAISGERGAVYTGLYGVCGIGNCFLSRRVKIDVYIGMFNTDMYRWNVCGLVSLGKEDLKEMEGLKKAERWKEATCKYSWCDEKTALRCFASGKSRKYAIFLHLHHHLLHPSAHVWFPIAELDPCMAPW